MKRFSVSAEAEIVDVVRAARNNKTTLEIVGSGTKRGLGLPAQTENTLDVSGLSGIVAYEPDELVLTVKAGTRIAEIDEALRARSQCLGFAPADWGPFYGAPANSATIGGVLSADACGSARVRYGACRDHLLGFRAVNGLGESYKAGGRVVKNVTGFDLPKLMCGAMGTLGVLTEITLRVTPCAPRSTVLVVRDVAPEPGLALLRSAWSSPFGATGLAYIPGSMAKAFPELGAIGVGSAAMRVEGSPGGIEEKIAGLRALAPRLECREFENGEALFRSIENCAAFAGTTLDIWRVSIPPASAFRCVQEIGSDHWLADWAGGLLWIGAQADDVSTAQQIRKAATTSDGSGTLLRASDDKRRRVGVFSAEPSARAELTRAVKSAFDPLAIFSPGRMFEGL